MRGNLRGWTRSILRNAARPAADAAAVAAQNTDHAALDPTRPNAESASTHAMTHRPVAIGAKKKTVARE